MNHRTLPAAGVVALSMATACAERVAPPAMTPAGTAAVFRCGQTTVGARFAGGTLELQLGGTTYYLDRVEAASGARYAGKTTNDHVEFWNKGREATLTIGAQTYPTCQQADVVSPRGGEGDRAVLIGANETRVTAGRTSRWTT